ncbi:MAG TPA: DUF1843 domain-containing protein [Pyrinomonadaceae bacterium]|jgi:hypothetical protein|nr:DUF1843 domain-containing protein [Pyrinomonadaceae bacterium]
MPTSKKSSKKSSAAKSKQARSARSGAKSGATAAAARSGPVPPYGEAIRQASARGDVQEMRKLANASRKWLKEVQSALDKLDKSIARKSG